MDYQEKRNLDGYYFRVQRDGKWQNVCFSDMTEDEQDEVLIGRSTAWLKSLCKGMASVVRDIGDEFDIVCD